MSYTYGRMMPQSLDEWTAADSKNKEPFQEPRAVSMFPFNPAKRKP